MSRRMCVIEHCWCCNGTGKMELDRGQWTDYAKCVYCHGSGDFQERRKRSRRSTDATGVVKALEAIEGRCVRILAGAYGGLEAVDEIRIVAAHALRDAGGQ